MQYPLISEYVAAIKDAAGNLDKLANLKPVLDNDDEPIHSSGAFAVVFKMVDDNGKYYALKCFTEEQTGRAEAYKLIADELEIVNSSYMLNVEYYDKELFVDSNVTEDTEFPVLLMNWVDGETMDKFIADYYADEYEMSWLCYRFCKMAAWLRSQPFAHGDLKPDNIIVRGDGELVLIDYDGMFVPAMKGQKSPTLGTKDFVHPNRKVEDFDETIDDFTLASIALSLKAISLDCSLYEKYAKPDRLLFSIEDYRDMGNSMVFKALTNLLAEQELARLYSAFMMVYSQKYYIQISAESLDVEISNQIGWEKVLRLDKIKQYKKCIDLLTMLAKRNFSEAQIKLSLYYLTGKGVEKDIPQALFWIKQAAEGENHRALRILGELYERGVEGEVDMEKAYICYKKSSDLGNKCSRYHLGKCYLEGIVVDKNIEQAFCLIKESADMEYGPAQYAVAMMYKDGLGTTKNIDEFLKYLDLACNNDNADAKCEMGIMMYDGILVNKDEKKGRDFIRSASYKGVAKAEYKLALIIEKEKNSLWAKEAYDLFHSASNKGYYDAFAKEALYKWYGLGCDNDFETAINLFKKSAEKGCLVGMYHYGLSLIYTSNDQKQIQCGFDYLEKSAKLNHIESIIKLLYFYNNKNSIYYDKTKLSEWLNVLEDSNNNEAYHIIAKYYYDEEGKESEKYKKYISLLTDRLYVPALIMTSQIDKIPINKDFYNQKSSKFGFYGILYSDNYTVACNFYKWGNIKTAKLIESVNVIVSCLFEDSDIKEVIIPKNVKIIGNNPFSFCKLLKNISCQSPCFVVKDNMLFDGNMKRLICYWGNDKTIKLPNTLEIIDDNVFYGCKCLEQIELPNSLQVIGKGAFYGSGIREFVVPKNVTTIGEKCFSCCNSLKQITILSDIKEIPLALCSCCNDLERVSLSGTIRIIGDGAFYGCNNLEDIALPSSVEFIGSDAFSGCTKLKLSILSSSLQEIGDRAFYNCTQIKQISLPSSVSEIGNKPFDSHTRILCENNDTYFADDCFLYEHKDGVSIKHYFGDKVDVEIPSFVKQISQSAFEESDVHTVLCSKSLIKICDRAFKYCSQLQSIILNENLKEIGEGSFSSCELLSELTIPKTVIMFSRGVISSCPNLSKIIVKSNAIEINNESFEYRTNLWYDKRVMYGEYGPNKFLAGSCIEEFIEDEIYPELFIFVKNKIVCNLDGKSVDKHTIKVKLLDE